MQVEVQMKMKMKYLCYILVVVCCFSMMSCSRQVVSESWISIEGETVSNQQPGDANVDNETENGQDVSNVGDSSGNVAGTSGGDTSSNSGNTKKTTTSTKKSNKQSNILYRNITIKKSSTKLEDAYKNTFKGKTYTCIYWNKTVDSGFKNRINSFAQSYGCTIKIDGSGFEQVRSNMAKALSAGKAYDMVRMHGSWHPRAVVANLLVPLEDAFTTADVVTDTGTAGIDLKKSKYFAWGNHLYALTTFSDVSVSALYYNKKILKGDDDLLTLYKKGQWTWAKVKELALKYSDGPHRLAVKGFMDNSNALNDAQLIKETDLGNGQIKLEANFAGNEALIHALQFGYALRNKDTGVKTGLYAKIGKDCFWSNAEGESLSNKDAFLAGKILVYSDEVGSFSTLYRAAMGSNATGLDRNPDNLGLVPSPLGPDNKSGKYAAGWVYGWGAGRGCDTTAPKMVAAFCKYYSTYKAETGTPSATDLKVNAATQKAKEPFDKLYRNLNFYNLSFGTENGSMVDMTYTWNKNISAGGDITAMLKTLQPQAENHLKTSLAYQ